MHRNVLVTWTGAQTCYFSLNTASVFGQIRTSQLQTQESGQEKQVPGEDLGSHESLQVGNIQNFMLHPAFPLMFLYHWMNCLTMLSSHLSSWCYTNLYQSLEYCQNL